MAAAIIAKRLTMVKDFMVDIDRAVGEKLAF